MHIQSSASEAFASSSPAAQSVPLSSAAFSAIGIDDDIARLLAKNGISTPTSIQERAIPIALEGRDIVGIAQTGTGKTLAFVLPIIQRLRQTAGQALIVVPTRELALQVEQAARTAMPFMKTKLTTAVIIGGAPMGLQREKLSRRPRIIVATPGRLQDHLDRGWADLSTISTVVLDEADRMFDMGFAPQITKFLESIPAGRQTKLFSATMPESIARLANRHLVDPVRVEVTAPTMSAAKILQEICFVDRERKSKVLEKLLTTSDGLAIVFCRTKGEVAGVRRKLKDFGLEATEIHSDRSQSQRKRALEQFRSGRCRVLVATDVAARGIDVDDVQLVVNYDLPDAPEDYVHRIGRTGRAGRSGRAVSLATVCQQFKVRTIEKLTRSPLLLSEFSLPRPAGGRASEGSSSGRRGARGPVSRNGRTGGGQSRFSERSGGRGSFGGTSERSSSIFRDDERRGERTSRTETRGAAKRTTSSSVDGERSSRRFAGKNEKTASFRGPRKPRR